MPNVVVIAGPNGAGKSTAAPTLLRDFTGIRTYVNADVIAAGLSAYDVKAAAFAAGRVMARRLDELAAEGADFAFETTLSGQTHVSRLKALCERGYRTYLVFLWLPLADLAVQRVAMRVRLGGHDIPEADIRRRYERSLRNFFRLYRPMVDGWRFLDNSDPVSQRPIADSVADVETVHDPEVWNELCRRYG